MSSNPPVVPYPIADAALAHFCEKDRKRILDGKDESPRAVELRKLYEERKAAIEGAK